jgi:hypothetical protein
VSTRIAETEVLFVLALPPETEVLFVLALPTETHALFILALPTETQVLFALALPTVEFLIWLSYYYFSSSSKGFPIACIPQRHFLLYYTDMDVYGTPPQPITNCYT